MEFDIKTSFFVVLATIFSSVVLALMWLSLRQPNYDEVVANQSHKLKFFDSLGSSKKKEKVDKKAKKDKVKSKGKKKETSEDEETSNQTDEHSEAADNSPVVRKHKQQELHAEPHATSKAAELQQAAVKSTKETPVVQKSAVAKEKSKTVPVPAVESPKETKVKSEPVKEVGESSKDTKSDTESKNAKKEKKKAKQGENSAAVKDADVATSAAVVGNSERDAASSNGKKPVKEHATPTKHVEEKIEAQHAQQDLASPADGKKKTGAENKKKKADSAAASNIGVNNSANIGQEGLQWVQSVTQMELSADQKNILNDVLNKSPANQKAKNESQKHEDKPAAGAAGAVNVENEQLKATVAKLRQDVSEEKRKSSELEKQAKLLATEAAHVPQLVSEGKALRLQIEGLTRQQSEAVLAVQRLREENRQLKEASSTPRADDGTKMQLKLQMEEMSKLTLRLNTAENAKHNLEAKVARLEEQIQQTHRDKLETERQLREDLGRLQMQSAKDAERHQMQLRKAHQDCENLQHERDAARQQLEVSKEAEKKLQSALSDRLSSDDQVKQLRERNHELEVEKQKHEADLLQLTEINVKLNADFSSVRQKIVDLEKQVAESAQQKQSEHVQQSSTGSGDERHIQQLSSEISRLQVELDQQKEKNKELRARNGKALDALRNTEDIVRKVYREKEACEEQLKSREKGSKIASRDDSKVSQLQSDLQKKTAELDNRSKEVSTLREEVNSLKNAQSQAGVKLSELQSQLHQRDGEVKNLQSTVDKLQKQLAAEKQHAASNDAQSKLAEAESRLAQRQAEIDNLKSVISSLEKAAQSAADSTQRSGDNSDVLDRLSVTEQENVALLAQVAQYKTVLESTEGILKKLQASVETEERLWKEKVENAESVLQQIRSDNQALESELNTLRATHEKTKAELGSFKSQAKQNGSA